jgi:hypothetical protein
MLSELQVKWTKILILCFTFAEKKVYVLRYGDKKYRETDKN